MRIRQRTKTQSSGRQDETRHRPTSKSSILFRGERSARFVHFLNFNGNRVLLIDLDPQPSATFYFMDYSHWEHWQQTAGPLRTLFDAYLAGDGEQFDISHVFKRDPISVDGESIIPKLHVLPSHLALVLINIQLAAKAAVEEAIFSSPAVIRHAL